MAQQLWQVVQGEQSSDNGNPKSKEVSKKVSGREQKKAEAKVETVPVQKKKEKSKKIVEPEAVKKVREKPTEKDTAKRRTEIVEEERLDEDSEKPVAIQPRKIVVKKEYKNYMEKMSMGFSEDFVRPKEPILSRKKEPTKEELEAAKQQQQEALVQQEKLQQLKEKEEKQKQLEKEKLEAARKVKKEIVQKVANRVPKQEKKEKKEEFVGGEFAAAVEQEEEESGLYNIVYEEYVKELEQEAVLRGLTLDMLPWMKRTGTKGSMSEFNTHQSFEDFCQGLTVNLLQLSARVLGAPSFPKRTVKAVVIRIIWDIFYPPTSNNHDELKKELRQRGLALKNLPWMPTRGAKGDMSQFETFEDFVSFCEGFHKDVMFQSTKALGIQNLTKTTSKVAMVQSIWEMFFPKTEIENSVEIIKSCRRVASIDEIPPEELVVAKDGLKKLQEALSGKNLELTYLPWFKTEDDKQGMGRFKSFQSFREFCEEPASLINVNILYQSCRILGIKGFNCNSVKLAVSQAIWNYFFSRSPDEESEQLMKIILKFRGLEHIDIDKASEEVKDLQSVKDILKSLETTLQSRAMKLEDLPWFNETEKQGIGRFGSLKEFIEYSEQFTLSIIDQSLRVMGILRQKDRRNKLKKIWENFQERQKDLKKAASTKTKEKSTKVRGKQQQYVGEEEEGEEISKDLEKYTEKMSKTYKKVDK